MASLTTILLYFVVLAIFLIIDNFDDLLGSGFLLVLFLFTLANFRDDVTFMAVYYLIMGLIVVVFSQTKYKVKLMGGNVNTVGGFNLGFFSIPVLGILGGALIYLIIRVMSGAAAATVVGVPTLAVVDATPILVTMTAMLGVFENRFGLTVYNILKEFVGLFVAGAVVVIGFALFHLFAFQLAISSLLFSGIVMMLWLVSYELTQDDVVMTVSHTMHNFTSVAGKILSIGG